MSEEKQVNRMEQKIKVLFMGPDEITPYIQNTKKHPQEQIDKIAGQIANFGFDQPIVVDKDRVIIKGHGRREAALQLGLKKVPVIVASDLSRSEANAARIADNRVAQSDWDVDMLKLEFGALLEDEFDMDLTGFDDDELAKIMADTVDDDYLAKEDEEDDIPEKAETRCKKGDLWKLGEHYLLCGDATNMEDVVKLMGDEKAALVLTDPPYNVDYVGKTKKALKIENDKKDNDSFRQFLVDAFNSYYGICTQGAPIYVFHADTEGVNFREALTGSGFKLAQCLVWVKNSMVMGRQDYHWKHEPILYGWKEGKAHTWLSDRKQTTVWNFDRPTKNIEHPTMKPIHLLEYPIKNSSAVGSIVVDFFGGSGSTLIACEKTGRRCRTMELDPKYADVILERFEKYSGQKAERVIE